MTGATTAVGFGAAFRWVRRSSVRPPSPIDVKKLIANLTTTKKYKVLGDTYFATYVFSSL